MVYAFLYINFHIVIHKGTSRLQRFKKRCIITRPVLSHNQHPRFRKTALLFRKAFPFKTCQDKRTYRFRVIIPDFLINIIIIVTRTVILSSQSGYGTRTSYRNQSFFIYLDEIIQDAFISLPRYIKVRRGNISFTHCLKQRIDKHRRTRRLQIISFITAPVHNLIP